MKAKDLALDMLTQCVAGRTLQVARIVSAKYDQALAPYGITAHQLTLLSMVARRQPVAPRDLLPFLKMDQSTLSRNLDRMQAKGWIRFSSDPDDARSRLASLTAEGEQIFFEAVEGWREAQAWALEELGEHGVADIKSVAQSLNPQLPQPDETSDQSPS